jgi:glycosidase
MIMRIASIVLILIAFSCSPKKEEMPPVPDMKQPGKMVVYQMLTRLFANTKQVNKPYGTLEENGVGKFNDINDTALKAIKEMGVTHVWYTGVLEHAVLTDYTNYGIPLDDADVVKGRAGSPYAIKDYYDVNPDLATDVPNRIKEFENLIERTHNNNLKVLIDFVPNHVARSYKSDAKPTGVRDLGEDDDTSVAYKPTNNFYYLIGESFVVPKEYVSLGPNNFPTKDGKFAETPAKVTGNDQFTASPSVNEWFETIKLNYGIDFKDNRKTYFNPIPNTWQKMRDILVYWASKNVDGFRCDVAEMAPVEFWSWVIPQVKAIKPQIIFIAEIYNPAQYKNYLQTGGFDFLYEKVMLYDTLRLLVNGQRSTKDIGVIQEQLKEINAGMLHFLENHDEQRIASRFFAGNPWKAVPAMVISATVDKGPVMIYFGQEVGEPGAGVSGFSGDDGRTTLFDYWGVPEHQKWVNGGKFDGGLLSYDQKKLRTFYSTVLTLASTNPTLAVGDYVDLTASNIDAGNFGEDVHAFIRYTTAEQLVIVSNFGAKAKDIKISIPQPIATELQLSKDGNFLGKDILWSTHQEIKFTGNTASLNMPAYSSYIFSIQQ